ncbi:MAG: ATP-binding protein, partial [Polyangiaceae bacterium]
PLEQLRRMRINDINTLTDDEVQEEMRNAQSGRRRCFHFRHRTARSEIRDVDVYSGPVTFGGRRLLLSIIHDVSDREALRRQLRQAQQLEAVGRLAGSVAHEFNNLLTVMLGAWSMLERSVDESDAARRFVDDLGFSTERAVELSRGLLAFSRRQVLQPQALDLNHVVDDLISLLQRSLGSSIAIELDLDPTIPESLLDPRQIETVLMNLVLNAADAMPDGGTITIRSTVRERFDANDRHVPWLTLVVADDGKGMDEQTLQRVFEPFFSTKGPGRGTGLGLATVQGIVEQVGGDIDVSSRIGEGTEFVVFLPIVDAPSNGPPPAPSLPKRAPRVLLVEDNEPVRRALAQGLSHLGHHVVALGTAEEGRASDWSEIDVLVTDVALPGVSGATLAAEAVATANLPTIIISGDLHRHDLSALPDRVIRLEKPITPSELARAIERAMAGAPPRSGGGA